YNNSTSKYKNNLFGIDGKTKDSQMSKGSLKIASMIYYIFYIKITNQGGHTQEGDMWRWEVPARKAGQEGSLRGGKEGGTQQGTNDIPLPEEGEFKGLMQKSLKERLLLSLQPPSISLLTRSEPVCNVQTSSGNPSNSTAIKLPTKNIAANRYRSAADSEYNQRFHEMETQQKEHNSVKQPRTCRSEAVRKHVKVQPSEIAIICLESLGQEFMETSEVGNPAKR
ncbi:Hypothetical predicted protein, partial [Podarcis lilfordi]